MKLKLDENLPNRLAVVLQNLGHDVHTVQQEGLSGSVDREIWDSAQKESRVFVTQDLDFSDLRKFVPGAHAGIVVIRLHTPSWKRLTARVEDIFRTEDVGGWPRCFIVATETKVRVVRPQKV